MADTNLPTNYVLFNSYQSKNPVIVLKIIGAPDLLTNRTLKTKVLFGDPGIEYGQAGLVYGGLRNYSVLNSDGSTSAFKDYLDLDGSSLTLQQRLEPEQGKASVSTISLAFIDKDGYMTKLVSPGQIIDEILLAEAEVYLGFAETSYPQDFFRLFRGYISSVTDGAGNVVLQISDANLKLRTSVFYTAQTELYADITATDNIITVVNNGDFYNQILQPDLVTTYNDSVHTYIQIDSEWIEAVPILQGNSGYTAYIQGLTYTAQLGYGSDVSIAYIAGGTVNNEVVTVLGSAITVQIQDGVSTNYSIQQALLRSAAAYALVTTELYIAYSTNNTVQSQVYLSLQTYNYLNVQGVLYKEQPFVVGMTIIYANTGTAGNETVSVSGTVITVSMQSGVSTAATIYSALVKHSYPVNAYVDYQLLPNSGGTIQYAQGSTAFVTIYPQTAFAVIQRGAQPQGLLSPTTASSHDAGATVAAAVQIGDLVNQENALDMALKIQLSGWGKPFISGVSIQSLGVYPDPFPSNPSTYQIVLPNNVDAVEEYGLTPGDFVYVSNSATSANNYTPNTIVRFADLNGQSNRLIYVTNPYTKDNSGLPTVSFRSQYDVYPIDCGMQLSPKDVDVAQHVYIKETFLGISGNDLIFFITAQEDSGKDFIQSEIYYPIGAYGLTRYGKLSCGYNAPPLASQNITVLDETNVLNPEKIIVTRAVNNRTFFNEIDISYAPDDQGNFQKILNEVSSVSLARVGGYTNVLPINSRGLYATYPQNLLEKYATFLLNRYALGASIIPLTVTWEAGSVIEVGDVVLLDDSKGVLQIANFQTGQRGLGKQLFNVIDRTFDIKNGQVSVGLQGNLGVDVTDRFATISPSSVVGVGSTVNQVIITDSFGAIFPGNESKKWANYFGLPIVIHSFDWSVSGTTTLNAIDSTNNYALNVSGLSFVPLPGYIVDIAAYPSSTDPTVNQIYKEFHAFLDPTVTVVTGVNSRNFTVSSGNIAKFRQGAVIRIHSYDYTVDSGELSVSLIVGDQITVSSEIGFTPSAGQLIDLIGFPDGGQPYRFL